ncbi:MAG: SUF system Fe-S cluster assembly regulator [Arenimonas sp.]
MLRITKLTDYATVLLAALAAAPTRVHSAADLAAQAHLELPTVSKVLKPLAHAGLVTGFRGANGGYKLARPAREIRLIDIVEAIEGKLGLTECSGEHSLCEHETHCGTRGHWNRVNEVVADALRGVSLQDMLPTTKHKAARTIPLQLAQGA